MSRVLTLLTRADRRRLGILITATVVITGIAAVVSVFVGHEDPWFGLDSEHAFQWPIERTTIALPALWSGLLLAGAGVSWLAVSTEWPRRRARWLVVAFGLFLLFVSVDENLFIHERIEYRVGVDWMVIYGPVMVAMAGVIFALLGQTRRIDKGAAASLTLGCAFWVASLALEYLQWDGDTRAPNYVLMLVPEELGEVMGSLLIGLAAVAAAKSLMRLETQPPADITSTAE